MVEIYTRIYIRRAGMTGAKLRTRAELNLALEGLGSPPARCASSPTTTRPTRWSPPPECARWRGSNRRLCSGRADPEIARTEGVERQVI